MHLTRHTDIALRTLLLLADAVPGSAVTAEVVAERFRVNRHHLAKVVQELAASGLVTAKRGAGGGLTLARPAGEIRLTEVIQRLEPNLDLLECFDPATSTCPITHACRLRGVLGRAQAAFFAALGDTTLADLQGPPGELTALLGGSASA